MSELFGNCIIDCTTTEEIINVQSFSAATDMEFSPRGNRIKASLKIKFVEYIVTLDAYPGTIQLQH
jgi:hypothetical protein